MSIAGTLDPRVGGPSVYPSQPHGLWREISHFGYGNAFSAQAFYPSGGSGQYRRSMYTFWKRTAPPPNLQTFDAPTAHTPRQTGRDRLAQPPLAHRHALDTIAFEPGDERAA